ncbi:MAG: hypothetical protein K6T31_09070, partial [Alicyclobacillus sp.]|nr:hypothetical protein [Alicyclobacillus sp.]
MDRLLHNNVVLRVIALVLSCILWLAVNTGSGGPDTSGYVKPFTYSVRVEVPSGMVATSVDVQTATVEVQTDAFHAAALAAQMMNVSVVADARGLGPGRHAVPLVALNMPAVAYTLQPAAVNVVLEPLSSAEKPVVVTLSGKPAGGYATGTPQPAAPEVTVSGPQSRVASVARVMAVVSVDGATQTVNSAASLRAVDNNGQPVSGVEVNPASLRVTVPVQAVGTSVHATVQITGRPAAGWAVAGVDISPQNLTATGTAAATLKSLDIPVDVSGWQSTRTVTVDVPRPSGVDQVVPD